MRALLFASAMFLPTIAWADSQHVPAIQTTAAASASASAAVMVPAGRNGAEATPAGMPPAVHILSPSAPLNAKEKASAVAAAAWRNHNDKPVRGENGVLRWPFGSSLPSVVCAPLQVCDVALEPGEVVNEINPGDRVRWLITPAVTGSGSDRTTHLIIKPTDAGLISSMLVFTDRRTYSIKLISTQAQWTPLTAFTYPESAEAAWENYGATFASTEIKMSGGGSARGPYNAGTVIDFNYRVDGDAPWRPLRVYSIAGKTFIQFPSEMKYGSAPVLLGLANDGGWFFSPSEQMLRYRVEGDRYVVDGLLDHAKLVTGVGSGQTKIDIKRTH